MRLFLVSTALAGAGLLASVTSAQEAKPRYGNYGIDTAGMDKSIAPGDDFFGYVNGNWEKTTQIPADKSSAGLAQDLVDLSRDRVHAILEAAAKDPNSKIGMAYAAYLDTATIDKKGLAPIQPWLDTIKALKSKSGYPALVAQADRNGIGTPFNSGVEQDAKNPEQYIFEMEQDGLGLPDRDYYLDARFKPQLDAYRAHIAKMFTLAGEPDAEARAKAIVDFETEIAKVSWNRVDSRDADKTYNRMTVAELQKRAPGYDFAAYLAANGTPVASLVVDQPSAFTGIARLIEATPLEVLKDQLLLRSLDNYGAVLPAAFDAERFAMYGTVLRGTPQQAERWKRAADHTSNILTDEVAKPYVAKYFPPATKAAIDLLVKNVIAALSDRVGKLDWMTPETKAKARAKLAAFTPRLGYPSQWHDYSKLRIVAGDAFGNALRANQWQHDWNKSKLGQPIYRWEWFMTPMTVNAQANPTLVAITFPAAILQPPYFDPNADPAVNYGSIGAIIGHEISHHYDDQGAKFDKTGRLIQWWTDADIAAFKARTDKLVAQYDAYEPLPGMHIKGALTLGENAADLAGLNAALDAYHTSLGGKPAPVIDGTTGDQRFFMAYAQGWRLLRREADQRKLLVSDPHAPEQARTFEVRNMDAWYGAFGVQPGAKLYLAPADRVKIW
jgi:putative endopeptidase